MLPMPSSVKYEKCSASSARSVASEILMSDMSVACCSARRTARVSFDDSGDWRCSITFWSKRWTIPGAQYALPRLAHVMSKFRNGFCTLTSSASRLWSRGYATGARSTSSVLTTSTCKSYVRALSSDDRSPVNQSVKCQAFELLLAVERTHVGAKSMRTVRSASRKRVARSSYASFPASRSAPSPHMRAMSESVRQSIGLATHTGVRTYAAVTRLSPSLRAAPVG